VPPELDEIVVQGEIPNYHWWDEDKDASLLPSGLFHFLRQLCSFLAKYDTWLLQPHYIMAGRVRRLKDDIHQLCFHVKDQLVVGSYYLHSRSVVSGCMECH
jgi:hypothetical protein